ncbi:MAG: glutamate--tRNA ligase, partial [Methanobacterium sp.]
MENLKDLAYKYALQNAVKHKGKAQNGAVMGSIMSSHPEFRKQAKEVSRTVGIVVAEVNALSISKQAEELEKFGGMVVEEKNKEVKGLVDLPDVEGKVVLRFAPNP